MNKKQIEALDNEQLLDAFYNIASSMCIWSYEKKRGITLAQIKQHSYFKKEILKRISGK